MFGTRQHEHFREFDVMESFSLAGVHIFFTGL